LMAMVRGSPLKVAWCMGPKTGGCTSPVSERAQSEGLLSLLRDNLEEVLTLIAAQH